MAEMTIQWQLEGVAHEGHVTDDPPAILGREAGCAVRIESETVSRKHAQIRRRADGFAITNLRLGSNPVQVNGREISAETPLQEGDTIQLGSVTLQIAAVRGIAVPNDGPVMKLRWDLDGRTHEETVRGGEPITIGRIAPATILIPSDTVSRQHAQIAEKGGRFVITDSTAGRNTVTVNQRALSGERYLSPGDVIQLGAVKLVVTLMQGAASQKIAGITELHEGRLVHCPTCHREVEARFADCPWCGTALVNAETVLPGY